MPLTGFVCQANIRDSQDIYIGNVYSRFYANQGWVYRTIQQGQPDDTDFTPVANDDEARSEPAKWARDAGYQMGGYACPDAK
jgi:hypothetical protein